mmetsp:Transcript_4327/g.9135  ORF Transcript_4327/g.9135 Transcript_4327/m.9135 type:complete len:249 (-) Transcript_4327:215-961(-)
MVSAVIPPLASTITLGCFSLKDLASFLSCAGRKLSSITISAPASAASSASSRFWHSTSIFWLKPAALLASFTASVIDPALQMWLSFNMTIWLRSSRCVAAPPTKRPYFSTTRKPGVVFLVPATRPSQPCSRALRIAAEEAVATPEQRLMVHSAVRSPRRIELTGPETVASFTLVTEEARMYDPSTAASSHATSHPNSSNTAWKNGRPANTPGLFIHRTAVFASSPTTNPPTSNDGMSSSIHSRTVDRI